MQVETGQSEPLATATSVQMQKSLFSRRLHLQPLAVAGAVLLPPPNPGCRPPYPDRLPSTPTKKDLNFHGYNALLTRCIDHTAVKAGRSIHAHMITARYRPPIYLSNRIVVLYVKCGCLGDARLVFDEMRERSVVSFTALMSGYAKTGGSSEALRLFFMMMGAGIGDVWWLVKSVAIALWCGMWIVDDVVGDRKILMLLCCRCRAK